MVEEAEKLALAFVTKYPDVKSVNFCLDDYDQENQCFFEIEDPRTTVILVSRKFAGELAWDDADDFMEDVVDALAKYGVTMAVHATPETN